MQAPHIRKAVAYLESVQRDDGGWGEDCATYWLERRREGKASTPSQTSWALLALMAAGEVDSPAVEHGIDYLLHLPREGAKWQEDHYTGTGFPRVFYIATTATAPTSRSGPWPATATSARRTSTASDTACEPAGLTQARASRSRQSEIAKRSAGKRKSR